MNRPQFQHGLVIGKFYPPHVGHEYLIRTAALHSRAVTVAVLGASAEKITIEQRVHWLRDAFASEPHVRIVGALDDAPVDYNDAVIWQAHIDIMRDAIRQADASGHPLPPVDVVFTSESYGDRMAGYFNSPHVCLDQTRSLYAISGTAVRADIPGQWHMLSPAVQAGMALRVIVVGAESTGTTTLSRDLVTGLRERGGVWERTQWVAEYGREYSANLLALARATNPQATAFDLVWQEADFVQIAREQCLRENTAAARGSPLLVCDTDAMATCIWHERYMGCGSATVNAIAEAMPARAIYILTSDEDVPFEDDGLRDGEHLRQWMTQRFREALSMQQTPWFEVHGTPSTRCQTALEVVEALMAERWDFAPSPPTTG
jgi:NadR type nicotinamide-nucleotide adenylyltransferase